MNKKFLVSATAAALVASAVVPAANAASFKDIETAVDHKEAILSLADMKIISGYPDGTFKPNATVTRGNVVKFLGKWLVQRGYSIPKDALTKQRFTDVPVTLLDKELVQYAALVKDAKVFEGSNNQLNFNGQMNRQNMALVLTRAVKQVYKVDLIERYKVLGFKSEITDIKHLAPYQIEAIVALESMGITKVKKYNPGVTLTRAQFASFLNRTINEVPKLVSTDEIVKVDVVSPTDLSVTFKGGRVVAVKLLTPLKENVEQEIVIYIDKKPYTVKVKYVKDVPPVTPTFAVKEHGAVNGGQYAITFNEELDPATIKMLKATFKDIAYNVENKVVATSLSSDKKTIVFTLANYMTGQYEITLDKVISAKGAVLQQVKQSETFKADTLAPRIKDAEYIDIHTTRLYFSEPMKAPIAGDISIRNKNEAAVQSFGYKLGADGTYVDLDLTQAHVGKEWVEAGEELVVYTAGMKDLAGNKVDSDFQRIKVKKGNKDGKSPSITGAKQYGPRVIEMTFSEPIVTPDQDSFKVEKRGVQYDVQTITLKDGTESTYLITLKLNADQAHPEGKLTIMPNNNYIVRDISGEQLTNFAIDVDMTVDKTSPKVVKQEVMFKDGREYLALTYDRDIKIVKVKDKGKELEPFIQYSGSFVDKNSLTNSVSLGARAFLQKNGERQILVPLADMLNGHDYEGITYNGSFKMQDGVVSTYDTPAQVETISFSFKRGHDTAQSLIKAKVDSVKVVDNDTIQIVFNREVDAAIARNVANYKFINTDIEISKVDVTSEAPDTVILTLKENTNTHSGKQLIRISGVKAKGSSVEMDSVEQEVMLTENVRPYLVDHKFGDKELQLTFSEALTVPDGGFIIPNNMVATYEKGTDVVTIKMSDASTLPATITVKGKDITDIKGNVLKLEETFTKK